MADREDATAGSVPTSTSVADHEFIAPSDAASNQLSSDLKEAVKEAPPAIRDGKEGSDETYAKAATNGSDAGSASKKDIDNPPSTDKSDENLEKDMPTESKQSVQKDVPTEDSSERPAKRMRESNVKSDLISQPISRDPVAIRKQVGI